MRTLFSPVDRLTLAFTAALAAITLSFPSTIPVRRHLIVQYAAMALIVSGLAVLDRKTGGARLVASVRVFSPVAIILIIFNSLGDLIPAVSPRYYDDVLIRIDFALFGVHPTLWLERFNHAALTCLFQAAYISYYFMPVALGAALFFKEKRRELDAAVFAVVFCFYLSYVGYLLVPAVGPRFTLHHLQSADLPVDAVTLWIRETLDGFEQNKTDAFPSGHTAIALVTLIYAGKSRERAIFRTLVPAVAALMLSTVYLRYHYVIDVIAGVLLALATHAAAPGAYRIFSGSSREPAE